MNINSILTRYILTFSILILNCVGSFAQTINEKIERMRISHCGDSLITQQYELDLKSRKVYFITPISNYLDIKGEKKLRRVKIDKSKRKEIFKYVYQLNLTNLGQMGSPEKKTGYYVVNIYFKDKTTYNVILSDDKIPKDLKKLYDTIIDKK